MDKNKDIISDLDKKRIVIINDIRFKGKRNIDWEKVEEYLKKYVDNCYKVDETKSKRNAKHFPIITVCYKPTLAKELQK